MFKYIYVVLLFATPSLYGLTTLHVSLSSDNNPGGAGDAGDLRYCLNAMNTDLNSTPDDYAIVFDMPMTISLNGILPIINNSDTPVSITIGNSGSIPTVILDGQDTYPGFFIPMGNVTIQNITFQNMVAQGGNGGDGISGGGGGMGAGGAIYASQFFLNGSNPSVTLINVSINTCTAVGGNGGSYVSATGNEGGGGGGGYFGGNGGSVTATGRTGGGGGGGFGGNGGNATLSADDAGGGGGGGGGLGSRATLGTPVNLGNGGSDQDAGQNGSGYGLTASGGQGGGGNFGGIRAGGGGGGGTGGGGGGSRGVAGELAEGSTPPGGSALPSGGSGDDGGGGGGAGVVAIGLGNVRDGSGGSGGIGGGGGGGAGTGAYDTGYTVRGGSGGLGGGGGGGGVNDSNQTPAEGGNSLGGGGGGGGGPSNDVNTPGGTDTENLGGGAGGQGAYIVGAGSGGGGGGGGSGLGGAIFVDSNLNFTIQAFSGIPTIFTTVNTTVQAGAGGSGSGGSGAENGDSGSAEGNSIFLRTGSSLTFIATDVDDLLTLGEGVAFVDDTTFGGEGTSVFVRGNGTVIYNGTSNYAGSITINNANFKVNGEIATAPIFVCRNIGFSEQRGMLSGSGTLTGGVSVNSGTISPDAGETLTLGSLTLLAASPGALGALVHSTIDTSGASLVAVTGAAQLAGVLELAIDSDTPAGTYTLLTSSGITGTFDSVTFTGATPNYTLSYLPLGSPTRVDLHFAGFIEPPSNLQGQQKKNNFGLAYELYNQLLWTLSPSSQTAAYLLYRDGQEIATLPATASLYQDHNRPFGVSFLYALIARDSNGNMSTSATVTVP